MVDSTYISSTLKAKAGRFTSLRPCRAHVLKTSKPKDVIFAPGKSLLSLLWVTWPPDLLATVLVSPTEYFQIFLGSGSQNPWLTGLVHAVSLKLAIFASPGWGGCVSLSINYPILL